MVWSLHALNWIIQQCTEQPELWSHMHQNVTLIVGLLQVRDRLGATFVCMFQYNSVLLIQLYRSTWYR